MSTASATIAFRVAPEIKRRADSLFSRLGMSTSTGMNVLLMQTLEHHGFPFPIVLSPDTDELEEEKKPNARVRATLDRVLAGTEPMSGPFHDVDEMFDSILKGE